MLISFENKSQITKVNANQKVDAKPNASKSFDFLDKIVQSFISLETDLSIKEANDIFKQTIMILNENTDLKTTYELYLLINSIISHFPYQFCDILYQILGNFKNNLNYLIISASIISNLNQIDPKVLKKDLIDSFVNESYYQIINQIDKLFESDFTVFNQKIPFQFRSSFIIDILLMKPQMNETSLTDILTYLITQKNVSRSKLQKLLNKIVQNGIILTIPDTFFVQKDFFMIFSFEDLTKILPKMQKDTFSKILTLIEQNYSEIAIWPDSFTIVILNKCIEFDIKFNLTNKLFNSITPSMINFSVWEYLAKYDIQITKIDNEINEFPNPYAALKTMPDLTKIPIDIITSILMETNDINLYAKIFEYPIKFPDDFFSSKEFWIHVSSLLSSAKEKMPEKLIDHLTIKFLFHVPKDKIFEIIEEMIMLKFPENNDVNSFIINLLDQLETCKKEEYNKKMSLLFQHIVEKNLIPYPSIWKIFNFSQIQKNFNQNLINPILMYAYEFTNPNHQLLQIKNISMMNLSLHSKHEILIDFIKTNNFDCIPKMDNAVFSIVMAAFIYASSVDKPSVIGLTNINILPFYAIALNYVNKKENYNLPNFSVEYMKCLSNACKLLSNKKLRLLIASIDSILSNLNLYLEQSNFKAFSIDNSIIILNSIIPILLQNKYKANKVILLRLIFSLSFKKSLQKNVGTFFEEYGVSIFKFIITNMQNIKKIDELKEVQLNLNSMDKISRNIINIIQNDKSNEVVINTINFIENYCINVPYLSFSNSSNIIRIFKELNNKRNWEEGILVGNFIINNFKNQIQNKSISNESFDIILYQKLFDIYKIISSVLNDPKIEDQTAIFSRIYNILMNDSSICQHYLSILLEKINNKQYLKINDILSMYKKEYNLYTDDFILALSNGFVLNIEYNFFIRKPNPTVSLPPQSLLGKKIISFLFDIAKQNSINYKILFCLYNISSSFPFLFNENPNQIFNIVLPALDYFSLYYTIYDDQINDKIISQIKCALTAIAFLFSSLYSIVVLNDFLYWIFNNINLLSDSQILSIIVILHSLFETERVNKILISFCLKYNFVETMLKILNSNRNEKLTLIFKNYIYGLLYTYYKTLNKLSDIDKIYINETEVIDNPIFNAFNNSLTIYPITFKPLDIKIRKEINSLNQISDYLLNMFNPRKFWLSSKDNTSSFVTTNYINNFVFDYLEIKNNCQEIVDLPELTKLQKKFEENQIRILCHQPNWVFDLIFKKISIPLLTEHSKILLNVISIIHNDGIRIEKGNENIVDNNIPISFIHFIINDIIKTNEELFPIVYKLIKSITQNNDTLFEFLSICNDKISNLKDESNKVEILNNFIEIFVVISKNNEFQDYFIKICAENLIETSLTYEFRTNSHLLSNISKLLCRLSKNLPWRVQYIIGFMFLLNEQQIIPQALDLCEKIDFNHLCELIPLIEKYFTNELNSKNPSYSIINYYIKAIPSLLEKKSCQLLKIFNKTDELLNKQEKEDENILEFIFSLFNYFAPKRNNFEEVDYSAPKINNLNENLILDEVPIEIKQANPEFWSIYDKNRKKIEDLIQIDKNIIQKLNILRDYPELLTFQERVKIFHERMTRCINFNKVTKFTIDRSNIVESTFNQIEYLENQDFLNSLVIKFSGEEGIDAGGLTNEWFTQLIKGIFNQHDNHFKLTDKKLYHPNPLSAECSEYIEFFRCTGLIIARALMNGHFINAHFTKSFYKQILNRKIVFNDIEDYDTEIYQSLKRILDIDVKPLDLTFSIDIMRNDSYKTILLKDDGDQINVTNENKNEYVDLYAKYHLEKSIKKQIDAFCEGFYSIIPQKDMNLFFPCEMDLLLCGITQFDVNDLRKNIKYKHPYHNDHRVINIFFNVLSKWNNDDLSKFLIFLTGSSQIPVNGFIGFHEIKNPITIASGGDKNRLCVAHTCFNILELPQYENEEQMDYKLRQSIEQYEFTLI